VTLPKQTDAYRALAETIVDVEAAAAFAELTESGRLGELVQQGEWNWPNTFRTASMVPAVDYLRALRVRAQLQRDMAAALKDVDLYVTVPFQGPTLAYTNLTGHPTLVTRCGMLDGLPQSIEFVGALYREDAILRVALAYERATPWRCEHPDTEKIPSLPGS
jgi:Asp-tRNA(Asn)/Glu-tRNA(Gln) amidotransferase A subunit family amidase